MANWKRLAEEEKAAGYLPGNAWEMDFRASLESRRPELARELGADLEAYCQVQTANAMNLAEKLEDQGTPPMVARELAMQQLMGG